MQITADISKISKTVERNLTLILTVLSESSIHFSQSSRVLAKKNAVSFRSSHQSCSVKEGVLRNFTKFTGKHLWQNLFFNKVPGLRPATLSKKRLWHRCFPVNFMKFLRTPFYIRHLWWLLLQFQLKWFSFKRGCAKMHHYAGRCKGICSYNLVYNFLIQLLPLQSSLFVVHFSNPCWHGNEAFPKGSLRMKLFLSL